MRTTLLLGLTVLAAGSVYLAWLRVRSDRRSFERDGLSQFKASFPGADLPDALLEHTYAHLVARREAIGHEDAEHFIVAPGHDLRLVYHLDGLDIEDAVLLIADRATVRLPRAQDLDAMKDTRAHRAGPGGVPRAVFRRGVGRGVRQPGVGRRVTGAVRATLLAFTVLLPLAACGGGLRPLPPATAPAPVALEPRPAPTAALPGSPRRQRTAQRRRDRGRPRRALGPAAHGARGRARPRRPAQRLRRASRRARPSRPRPDGAQGHTGHCRR